MLKSSRSVRCEDQRTGGYPRARGDQDMLVVGLVVGRTAHLAHTFGNAVHAVDVRLAEQAAVRVDRQIASEGEPFDGSEVLGLTLPAEPELLELSEHEGGEVIVEKRRLYVD